MIAAVTAAPALAPAPATTPPAGDAGAFGAMLAMLAPTSPMPTAADAGETIAAPPPAGTVAASMPVPAPLAIIMPASARPVDDAREAEAPADETETTGDEAESASASPPPLDLTVAMPVPQPVQAMPVDVAPPAPVEGETPRRAAAVLLDGTAHGAIAWRAATATPVDRAVPAATGDAVDPNGTGAPATPAASATPTASAAPEASTGSAARSAPDALIAPDARQVSVPTPRGGKDPIGASRGDAVTLDPLGASPQVVVASPPAEADAAPRAVPGEAGPATLGSATSQPATRDAVVSPRADWSSVFGADATTAAPLPDLPAAPTRDAAATIPPAAASGDAPSVVPAGPSAVAAAAPATIVPAATAVTPPVPAAIFASAFMGRGDAGVVTPPPVAAPAPAAPGARVAAAPADEIVAMTGLDLDALFPADRDAPLTVSHPRAEAVAGDAAFAAALAPAVPAPAAGDAGGVAMPAAPAEVGIQHHLDVAHDGAWLDRLARDIALSADRDSHMRFQLNPERLGALTVDIANGADGASVRFTADNEAARALIADAQPRLVAEARAQGMRIADAQVDVSGGNAGGQQGGAANPFAQAQGQSGGQTGQQQPGAQAAPRMSRAAGRAATVAAAPARAERYA